MIKAVIFDCYGIVVGKGIWKIFELAGGDLKKCMKGLVRSK